jgi:hypothetical protein
MRNVRQATHAKARLKALMDQIAAGKRWSVEAQLYPHDRTPGSWVTLLYEEEPTTTQIENDIVALKSRVVEGQYGPARRIDEEFWRDYLPALVPTVVAAARYLLTVETAPNVGLPYEYIVRLVRAQFPSAKTTVNSLRVYAHTMRRQGKPLPFRPTGREFMERQP